MGGSPAEMDTWITDTEISTRFPYYTRANADEVGPEPFSPLGWSLAWMKGCIPGRRRRVRPVRCVAPRRVRRRSAGGVRQLGRLLLQPALAAPAHGRPHAGRVSPKRSTRVLRGPPGRPEVRRRIPTTRTRRRAPKLAETMGWAMSTTTYPAQEQASRRGDGARGHSSRSGVAVERGTRRQGASAGRPRARRGLDRVLPVGARRVARPRRRPGDLCGDRTRGRCREAADRSRQHRVGRCPDRDVGAVAHRSGTRRR